jgi:hypothetical protein
VGLYRVPNFPDPGSMEDYVQYGGVTGFREGIAVMAGLWTAGTFASGSSAINLPVPTNNALNGLSASAQAAVFGGGYTLCNAYSFTVGF